MGDEGKDKETYTGVAKFLDFLAKAENAAEGIRKPVICQSPKQRMT